jgi:hypothetical protein
MAGGPVGLAALGGMAAVSAAEYVAASRRGPNGETSLDDLGRPSQIARELADRLDHDTPVSPADNDPWRDEPGRRAFVPEGGSA